MRKQVPTAYCSTEEVMCHPNFARGLDDIRAGRAFDADAADEYWAYERGRAFGAIAPLSMPLFIGEWLNPKAIKLYDAACCRGLIL
jgi:hypothetical protein